MRPSAIRPTFSIDPVLYRCALLLHANLDLDAEHKDVDLTTLWRSQARLLLLSLEKRTGLRSGVATIDSLPED